MSYRSLQEDIEIGKQGEIDVLPSLQKFFGDNSITSTNNQYSRYDFIGSNKTRYEVKTRTNSVHLYDDTLIPLSKLKQCKDNIVYFIFNFTDGIYYIKYNKELFDTFKVEEFRRKPRFGIVDYRQKYVYIPVKELSRIC